MTISATTASKLFSPIRIGPYQLNHRLVLSPMQRLRADQHGVPKPLMAEYYAQRTTPGGLLVTESAGISPTATDVPFAAGIYTQDQIDGWKRATEAVHAKGGIIFQQIYHVGRATAIKAAGVVAPSPIAIRGKNRAGKEYEPPRAATIEEIKSIVKDYAEAAKNAIKAGFDGVEIHGGYGYLVDQFLNTCSNKRTDEYGGPVKNRTRFALEVVDAVVEAVGAPRTGIWLSPWSTYQDMHDDTPYETWGYLVRKLQHTHSDLAYLHFVESNNRNLNQDEPADTLAPFCTLWKGPFIVNGLYTENPSLAAKVADETGSLVSVGRYFISNPDLVERLKNDWSLSQFNYETFYTQEAEGYTDYPFYDPKAAAVSAQ